MTKTISRLWGGDIDPIRHLGQNNTEIKKMENLMSNTFSKLNNKLEGKTKELLEKYNDCVNDYVILISEQSFCDGFCIGTKLSAEALTMAEDVL